MDIYAEKPAVPIEFHHIKKAALIVRALNNPFRQRIYNFLLTADNFTVTNIVVSLDLKQSVVSQHLAILRRAKIVAYLKKGKFVYYHLNQDRIGEIHKFIGLLLEDIKPTILQKEG